MPTLPAPRLATFLLLALATLARAEGEPPAPPAAAPPATPPAAAPAAFEVVDRVYDAGKIDRGTVLKHVFTLKNVGTTELSIDAKPG